MSFRHGAVNAMPLEATGMESCRMESFSNERCFEHGDISLHMTVELSVPCRAVSLPDLMSLLGTGCSLPHKGPEFQVAGI